MEAKQGCERAQNQFVEPFKYTETLNHFTTLVRVEHRKAHKELVLCLQSCRLPKLTQHRH